MAGPSTESLFVLHPSMSDDNKALDRIRREYMHDYDPTEPDIRDLNARAS